METEDVWAAIDAHREATARLLETLDDDEWGHASLCEGWTVRDVAAHLTLQQIGVVQGLGMAVRFGLRDLNRMIRESARAKARRDAVELIAELRGSIGSRRHNLGLTPRAPLIDILVHSQDIAIPLGRELPLPPRAAAEAARQLWSDHDDRRRTAVFRPVPWQGLRFEATDADWAAGSGELVRGPMTSVLLTLTGRDAGLEQLTGPGVRRLRAAAA